MTNEQLSVEALVRKAVRSVKRYWSRLAVLGRFHPAYFSAEEFPDDCDPRAVDCWRRLQQAVLQRMGGQQAAQACLANLRETIEPEDEQDQAVILLSVWATLMPTTLILWPDDANPRTAFRAAMHYTTTILDQTPHSALLLAEAELLGNEVIDLLEELARLLSGTAGPRMLELCELLQHEGQALSQAVQLAQQWLLADEPPTTARAQLLQELRPLLPPGYDAAAELEQALIRMDVPKAMAVLSLAWLAAFNRPTAVPTDVALLSQVTTEIAKHDVAGTRFVSLLPLLLLPPVPGQGKDHTTLLHNVQQELAQALATNPQEQADVDDV